MIPGGFVHRGRYQPDLCGPRPVASTAAASGAALASALVLSLGASCERRQTQADPTPARSAQALQTLVSLPTCRSSKVPDASQVMILRRGEILVGTARRRIATPGLSRGELSVEERGALTAALNDAGPRTGNISLLADAELPYAALSSTVKFVAMKGFASWELACRHEGRQTLYRMTSDTGADAQRSIFVGLDSNGYHLASGPAGARCSALRASPTQSAHNEGALRAWLANNTGPAELVLRPSPDTTVQRLVDAFETVSEALKIVSSRFCE